MDEEAPDKIVFGPYQAPKPVKCINCGGRLGRAEEDAWAHVEPYMDACCPQPEAMEIKLPESLMFASGESQSAISVDRSYAVFREGLAGGGGC